MFFLGLVLMLIGIAYIKYTNLYVKTSTLAAVMAIGIVTKGVLANYFTTEFHLYGKMLVLITVMLWGSFIFSLLMAFWNGKFKDLHLKNPINRFGIGTWVAASSICGILMYSFNNWLVPAIFISIVNIGLWIFYVIMASLTFYKIHKHHSYQNVHGVLLLTTVSTQSIILLTNTIYPTIPSIFNMFFLSVGILFYGIGVYFISKRYIGKTWSINDDWSNTNCILHGALSISGIASIVSGTLNFSFILTLWITTLTVFFLVEIIEIVRLYRRIKGFGFKKGVLTYDVTQWSRIFTFAMFDTFTFRLQTDVAVFSTVRHFILNAGIWIIIILILIEVYLSVMHLLQIHRQNAIKSQSTGVSY